MQGEGLPTKDQVLAALDKILGWPQLARSAQLAALLRYTVEKKLAGDEASIKAYAIAVDVFGRPQSFDPQTDPIVRVQARRLRTLLEQYYVEIDPNAEVRITLPRGGYVPEFVLTGASGTGAPAEAAGEVRTWRALPNGLNWVVVAASVVVISVALAVATMRLLPTPQSPANGVPQPPNVFVDQFDNLTGDATLDAAVAGMSAGLGERLGRFEALSVASTEQGADVLRGSVQGTGNQLSVRVSLAQAEGGSVLWSATIASNGMFGAAAVAAAVDSVAAQLGNPGGPLHASGLAWLARQTGKPTGTPGLYVCQLRYMAWRAIRKLDLAAEAIDCLSQELDADPGNGVALAMDAGLRAWRKQVLGTPGERQIDRMVAETAEAAHAITLAPRSSFAYEQQGLVLARSGSFDAAFGAFEKALELNPDNMDARASFALVLWLDGQWGRATTLAEQALGGIGNPPPWYFTTRAFNALRERRYFDAIDAAQAMQAGDDEFAPVIALAAAPLIGRTDLVDRYRPMVMGNVRFQATGILPRVALVLRQPVLVDRVREGLTLAGVPPAALNAPFRADGTPRL